MSGSGILGGTFDPVHIAHIQLAAAAIKIVGIEKVVFIPSGYPPHKDMAHICSFTHRRKMLELAVAYNDEFEISDIEAECKRLSYTYETLKALNNDNKDDVAWYFIIGSDAFLEIESWYRWGDVISATNFIIALRHGFGKTLTQNHLEYLGFTRVRGGIHEWHKRDTGTVAILLNAEIAAVSSTEIREKILSHKNWEHLVPVGVAQYIKNNSLYI